MKKRVDVRKVTAQTGISELFDELPSVYEGGENVKYTVLAFERRMTDVGVKTVEAERVARHTPESAESLARQFSKTGNYVTVHISFYDEGEEGYLNPSGQYSGMAEDWVDYYRNLIP
ncbi:hypothetical protein [Paenibacillus polysaccharolyticus]|uniref:hypothetical protein n=1 Tax=Paenibacillus polysaccharolyticus TaxID=582692 RepID=UPI00300AA0E9